MNRVQLDNVPALLDGDSIRVDPDWNLRRFPNRASEARRAIDAMNILQVFVCPIVPRTSVSC